MKASRATLIAAVASMCACNPAIPTDLAVVPADASAFELSRLVRSLFEPSEADRAESVAALTGFRAEWEQGSGALAGVRALHSQGLDRAKTGDERCRALVDLAAAVDDGGSIDPRRSREMGFLAAAVREAASSFEARFEAFRELGRVFAVGSQSDRAVAVEVFATLIEHPQADDIDRAHTIRDIETILQEPELEPDAICRLERAYARGRTERSAGSRCHVGWLSSYRLSIVLCENAIARGDRAAASRWIDRVREDRSAVHFGCAFGSEAENIRVASLGDRVSRLHSEPP